MTGPNPLEALLASAEAHAAVFAHGDAPAPPATHVVVVACMDARVRPETFLGLDLGDAHLLRNAGGRVTDDVLRSLIVSANLLGTREILVIHHTDCGIANLSQHHIATIVGRQSGADASDIDFHAIDDTLDALTTDVDQIRKCPYLPPDVRVSGWMYDLRTGRLENVVSRVPIGAEISAD